MTPMTKAERDQAFRRVGESLNRLYTGESHPRAIVTEHTPNHYSVRITSDPRPVNGR